MKILLAAALLAVPPAPPVKPSAPPPCLTRAEVTDLTLFLLPAVLDGAADQCRASLPAGAYLLTGGRTLSQRLMADTTHGAGAVGAIRKIAGDSLPAELGPDTLRGLAHDMLGKAMLADLKPADCGAINEAAELLAPLPPQNIGGLIAVGLSIAGRKAGKSGANISLCPARPQ